MVRPGKELPLFASCRLGITNLSCVISHNSAVLYTIRIIISRRLTGMWHATRMGILKIHETTPFFIVGISPLREIRLIWNCYIKLHMKEIRCETATQDRVQNLALVNTVPQILAIS